MEEEEKDKVFRKSSSLVGKKCRPTLCNIFFQEKEFMNIDNFYALKKLEWQATREHEAAIKIQSAFRGLLIKENMRLLNVAATKIQSLIRGFLARERVKRLKQELEEKKLNDERNKAATTIQKNWRGYYSRKYCFDYYKYKHVQDKNAELARSVAAMNELESLATSPKNVERSRSDMIKILRKLTNFYDVGEVLKLSSSRVCALQNFIEKINQDCVKKGGKPTPKNVRLAQQLKEECQKRRDNQKRKESLDQLFPDFPDVEGVIKPDKDKVAKLKEAIWKLRNKIVKDDQNLLAKKHHLLRTFQQPGVLSDICTHELTPMEKKLKALKFFNKRTTTFCRQAHKEQNQDNEMEQFYINNHHRKKKQSSIIDGMEDGGNETEEEKYNPWA